VWRGGLGGTYRLPALSFVGASLFHGAPSSPGGLNGATEHQLEVCLQESQELKSVASVYSDRTRPWLALIEYSQIGQFSSGSIVGSTE
jgi:hypothetical protein